MSSHNQPGRGQPRPGFVFLPRTLRKGSRARPPGQVQGIRPGTQFAVYPADTLDFTQVDCRQALVEIEELGAADSWARIVQSRQVLNVTVLDLQPDWGIAQVHPYNQDYDTLDPEAELQVKLRAGLAPGHEEGRDVLKVFATAGPASYKWLELPPLDGQRGFRGMPTNALEELMDALTRDQAPTRNITPVVDPSHAWSVAQVEVSVAGLP